jgi:hypothetical protein
MNKQLGAIALHNPSEDGPTETDMVFNDGLWPTFHTNVMSTYTEMQSGPTMEMPLVGLSVFLSPYEV